MVPLFSALGDLTLSHLVLQLGNISVDEEFNVPCILYWGSTASGPVTELLATSGPGLSSPPEEALTTAFRLSFTQHSQLEACCLEKADML